MAGILSGKTPPGALAGVFGGALSGQAPAPWLDAFAGRIGAGADGIGGILGPSPADQSGYEFAMRPIPELPLRLNPMADLMNGAGGASLAGPKLSYNPLPYNDFPAPEGLASRSAKIYDPPVRPARDFSADYPVTEGYADASGKLTKDTQGRALGARWVVGRNVVGGDDQAFPTAGLNPLAEATTGGRIEAGPASALPRGSVGAYSRGYDPSGNQVRDIRVLHTLPADAAAKVSAHEIGHMIDDLAGEVVGFDSAGPIRAIDQAGIKAELRGNYHRLNDPGWRRLQEGVKPKLQTSPESMGYAKGAPSDRELMAEAIRAYMADPNYAKTDMPKTAARIQDYVNTNPFLSKIIQFNSLAPIGAGLGGILGAAGILTNGPEDQTNGQ